MMDLEYNGRKHVDYSGEREKNRICSGVAAGNWRGREIDFILQFVHWKLIVPTVECGHEIFNKYEIIMCVGDVGFCIMLLI